MSEISTSHPFSFVLFGGSGHLAKIKIYPALYVLALKKRLPKDYAIVGYARSDMDDAAFRKLVEEAIREHMIEVTEPALEEFMKHVYYQQGQYDSAADFTALNEKLTAIEKGWKDNVRLAYYSVPPTVFGDISHNLCEGNVHDGKIPFRCIVEKPVGDSLESFEAIKKQLVGCFAEDEIYLLDHYLGKEAVRNIYYLRHANPIFERILKNTLIDHVEITAMENKGIEGRAGYFEAAGTFRDMFQSHLLMMASLLTMRIQSDEDLAAGRADALGQFYLPAATDMDEVALQAQYSGYQEEEGVKKGSRTNTFACLKLMTRISKWDGVPFYLHSGKKLEKKETRISIQFQEPRPVGEGSTPNRLDIILQGEAGMRMYLQTKMGGTEPAFRPLVLEDPLVCVGDCLPEHSLMILEAIHGKRHWFLDFDEVKTSWRLVDPVQKHLDASDTPLHTYKAGSKGPEAANQWIEKDGLEWF
ncbi:MAG: glucose-6-phosphate dehydrogenase (NADP(+)) [Candidatus Peribacter sp.]|jgi:glucose-6-phosphate 1-dehydrogenase|nr:glucose-6-phosphate dehydrogenase (NADP(+)) [Candidatus Peribacter sp.]MBT4393454.1 glucose-6-phosphate dehydrogenase (NADP(+)) [Candidatus Peribacter sp.]MBT4600565.1 glucose-6-phosphate dehydrogenase (NADP(+)) [Candidatus Peribacter sp.]MBT5149460.1 glucose-6-phosphate dehydrogenase (NADP(+)) [Candidatus Peribacter sp.]MBT5638590.1 glucose-6-phosphate dehydrogenase (NADP(+)) [Candidatus Peribacter sp.]